MPPDYYESLKLAISKSSREIFLNAKQVFEEFTIIYVRWFTSSIFPTKERLPSVIGQVDADYLAQGQALWKDSAYPRAKISGQEEPGPGQVSDSWARVFFLLNVAYFKEITHKEPAPSKIKSTNKHDLKQCVSSLLK